MGSEVFALGTSGAPVDVLQGPPDPKNGSRVLVAMARVSFPEKQPASCKMQLITAWEKKFSLGLGPNSSSAFNNFFSLIQLIIDSWHESIDDIVILAFWVIFAVVVCCCCCCCCWCCGSGSGT
jgi:hypothetical protein